MAINGNQWQPEAISGHQREARGGEPKAIFQARGACTPKVEERRCETDHVKLCVEVDGRVAEQVAARRARVEEGAPPPVIILVAELEVAEDNRDLGTREQQDEDHQREEAEDVVKALQPDRAHDEEELDEHGAERQDAAHRHRAGQAHVPSLQRHMACDLVRAHLWGRDGAVVSTYMRSWRAI